MEIDTRNLKNLNASDFVGKEEKYFIIKSKDGDCVTSEKRTSKKGNEYTCFTLHVQKEDTAKPKEIPFLFEKDLFRLVEVYGKETTKWENMLVVISSEEQGSFFNWVLKPKPYTNV